jgi:hypothetical protein
VPRRATSTNIKFSIFISPPPADPDWGHAKGYLSTNFAAGNFYPALCLLAYEFKIVQAISDHHQSWGHGVNPWKGNGPSSAMDR